MRYLASGLVIWFLCVFGGAAQAQAHNVSDIVAAEDAFLGAQTEDNRAILMAALASYEGEPTVETVRAHHILMTSDTRAGIYDAMFESAAAARAHYEPISNVIEKQFAEAGLVAAIASFNGDLDPNAMIAMAHVQGFATAQRNDNGERADWARDLMYESDAWLMTMDAYFESTRTRHVSDEEIEQVLETYDSVDYAANAPAAASLDELGLPLCTGLMAQKPKLRQPRNKFRKGMFGAVILGLEFDSEGQVINPRVLASVPLDEFDERSLETVGKWRFKPDDPDQVGVTCRLNRTDIVQPVVFQFR
ncbi:MAG: TonB family protein [Pseudomonadota bacterium]